MKELQLTTIKASGWHTGLDERKAWVKITFIIDAKLTLDSCNIDTCNFEFNDGSLTLNQCDVTNSNFNGRELFYRSSASLYVKRGKFSHNSLTNNFNRIYFQSIECQSLHDSSMCDRFESHDVTFTECIMKGSCSELIMKQTLVRKDWLSSISRRFPKSKPSIWNKIIRKSAICDAVIFGPGKVNPFYFAIRCFDKSKLDLTSATLIDDWSRLRKKYAGLGLFIVFLLTLAFILPLLTESFFLLLLAKMGDSVPVQRTHLWEVLLFGGKTGANAILYACLTVILVIYNVGRLYVTIAISRLREEEQFQRDANFQIVAVDPDKYKGLRVIDKVLSILLWISVAYSLFKVGDTMQILVPNFH